MLTEESRRASFPSLQGMVYLNTAAEGVPPLEVGAALQEYFRDKQRGMDGRDNHFRQWQAARELAANFFGLDADDVAICSCSSEAYNLAARALPLNEGDEVVLNDLDFPAAATPWLVKDCPATIRLWRARQGALRVEDLIAMLGPKTRLVSTSLVSFYNGYRLPFRAVVDAVRRHCSALLAVDVTQALGRIPLDVADADLIVSSTHKWILSSHGGGLVAVPRRREHEWTVAAGGWFNLEDAFGAERFARAIPKVGAAGFMVGMPNFPAIYAIRAGLAYIQGIGVAAIDATVRPLMRACLEGLSRLPVELLAPADESSQAGIVAFRHPKAKEISDYLRSQNIHVMHHAGRLRVSLHGYNTLGDVETLLRTLADSLTRPI